MLFRNILSAGLSWLAPAIGLNNSSPCMAVSFVKYLESDSVGSSRIIAPIWPIVRGRPPVYSIILVAHTVSCSAVMSVRSLTAVSLSNSVSLYVVHPA